MATAGVWLDGCDSSADRSAGSWRDGNGQATSAQRKILYVWIANFRSSSIGHERRVGGQPLLCPLTGMGRRDIVKIYTVEYLKDKSFG
jgi:hypothetical protein